MWCRHVEVTERRTALDFAHQMKWLVDDAYSDAKVVRVVLDNLNIHNIASLYVAFPAPEARRIARKLEFHLTPKHGSWLNVAESELAVLSSQCLNRRLPTLVILRKEAAAWERQRNTLDDAVRLVREVELTDAQRNLVLDGNAARVLGLRTKVSAPDAHVSGDGDAARAGQQSGVDRAGSHSRAAIV